MSFRIVALDPAPFRSLFALDATALAAACARRVVADVKPGFPCRVSLVDADPGETLILVNHQHLAGETPYRANHAIYLREHAVRAEPAPGEIPEVLRRRLLSLRAYDANDMMLDADVVDGVDAAAALTRMLADPSVAFVHLHNAKPGCYAARAERA
jgi:Protein of unknown function (DUF1203)